MSYGSQARCPLSPAQFGLYVDGLEKHLLEITDIDIDLCGILAPLLLYVDDLILMSSS